MLVSVCIATYNGARYIREQVDSILNQEFRENKDVELELVVSDDGSTDDTLSVLASYHDERIKVYSHHDTKKYKYMNASRACKRNFENAMRKASGEYIFLSDQDDVWYPWKMDKQLSMLRKWGGGKRCRIRYGRRKSPQNRQKCLPARRFVLYGEKRSLPLRLQYGLQQG